MEQKRFRQLVLLFACTYFVSYLTRINFGAVVSEMVVATGFSRSALSTAITGSFITYGIGQIFSGICGDHFSPKKLIGLGLAVTSAMNLLIPLCAAPWQMTALWCVNGLAQAFMWPPLVKLMTGLFDQESYKRATVRVIWGSSVGTVVIYLVSPALIALSGWKAVFLFSGICGAVMLTVWCCSRFTAATAAAKEKAPGNYRFLFSPMMMGIMGAIVLMGALRDGITTWMPSYIAETYNLGNILSILTGVLLPVFSIVAISAASSLHQRKLQNPITCAAVIFGIGALSALGLFLLYDGGVLPSALFSALLTGAMHGVNLMLITMLPAYFKKYGNVSTASGILNACTYLGSAISTYGIALLSERFGWQLTLGSWLAIALVGTILCLCCIRPWAKQHG